MIVAGIDYSYTSPAICIYDTSKPLTFSSLLLFNTNALKKTHGCYGNIIITPIKDYNSQEVRFRNLSLWAINILIHYKVELVVLEGYSLGSKGGLVFQIAENTSLLKQSLDLNNIPFITPSPSTVKKAFTGKGNADKVLMIETFKTRFNTDLFEVLKMTPKKSNKPVDDLVDAIANMLCFDIERPNNE